MVPVVPILSLWLPILLSAVLVFVLSTLIHMVLGYHKNDFRKLPDEGAFADALRKLGVPPGEYFLPYVTDRKEWKTPEFQEKVKKGPRAMLTVFPAGTTSMTSELIQWFLYSVVVGIFAAYVAGRALPAGAPYLAVFRFTGVTAFCSYTIAGWQASIWYKKSWGTAFRNTVDGLIYALFTAGVFGWLWPR
jgi:hypothetical protein